jgi:hypothetical protein
MAKAIFGNQTPKISPKKSAIKIQAVNPNFFFF